MFISSWFPWNLVRRPKGRARPPHAPAVRRRGTRLACEQLEDRCTPSFASLVADILPGADVTGAPLSSNPQSLVNINGTLFFTATITASDIPGSELHDELWKSDGTDAGTVRLNTVSNPASLTNVNGTLFFTTAATRGDLHNFLLWKSDGTAAGTVVVKSFDIGGESSAPEDLVNVNGTLFFSADDGVHGWELWKSDGTDAGTVMVKDISTGLGGGTDTFLQWFTNVNGTLFFTAIVSGSSGSGAKLWKSDGTEAGTHPVINPSADNSNPGRLTNVNGKLFFAADDDSHGRELWKSDGTPAGTVLVADIKPGTGDSEPHNLVNVNGTLFFAAEDDDSNGVELWKSDGTAAGTLLVKDINPGSGSSQPAIVNVNGTVFFSADDGTHGDELWKSDGTFAGTVLVRDISSLSDSSFPHWLTILHAARNETSWNV